jgi:hypothetical protein
LISIDGLHAVDLQRFVAGHPASTLARLSRMGTTYSDASASKPSDSYPGLLAIVTGGSPRSTGVFYDDSYDRRLSAPGSNCSVRGTEVVYDESIDLDNTLLNGGGGIDPTTLPLDGDAGCKPVYPHTFLRVNTIFEVIKAAGMRTAWTDKHLSYELVNGPSGHGVDDLFTPEIAAPLPDGVTPETDAPHAATYDDIKVTATLNQIAGKDHTGTKTVGVPAIFGMNFQAVSVGEKTAGYVDAAGTPSAALETALMHTDQSLGKMVDALEQGGLLAHTLIIVSAKHGQSPINRALSHIVDKHIIPNIIEGLQSGLGAQVTEDDVALIWLADQSKAGAVSNALRAHASTDFVNTVLAGDAIRDRFQDPLHDSRTPDVIALPDHGVVYTGLSATKIAEHGGFNEDDTHVGLLVAGPGFHGGQVIDAPVQTRQIAPTILDALSLDPSALQAVQMENTRVLPGNAEGDQ